MGFYIVRNKKFINLRRKMDLNLRYWDVMKQFLFIIFSFLYFLFFFFFFDVGDFRDWGWMGEKEDKERDKERVRKCLRPDIWRPCHICFWNLVCVMWWKYVRVVEKIYRMKVLLSNGGSLYYPRPVVTLWPKSAEHLISKYSHFHISS